jgi:K+-transporting ATPase KdpF subunit
MSATRTFFSALRGVIAQNLCRKIGGGRVAAGGNRMNFLYLGSGLLVLGLFLYLLYALFKPEKF